MSLRRNAQTTQGARIPEGRVSQGKQDGGFLHAMAQTQILPQYFESKDLKSQIEYSIADVAVWENSKITAYEVVVSTDYDREHNNMGRDRVSPEWK